MKVLKKILKILKKIWFPAFILLVLYMYFYVDKNNSIILTIVVIILLAIQIGYDYFRTHLFKSFLKEHLRIDDISIAKIKHAKIKKVKAKLRNLLDKNKKPGLIVLNKNTYISYNKKMVIVLDKILIQKDASIDESFRVLSKYGIETKKELQEIKKVMLKRQKI